MSEEENSENNSLLDSLQVGEGVMGEGFASSRIKKEYLIENESIDIIIPIPAWLLVLPIITCLLVALLVLRVIRKKKTEIRTSGC